MKENLMFFFFHSATDLADYMQWFLKHSNFNKARLSKMCVLCQNILLI